MSVITLKCIVPSFIHTFHNSLNQNYLDMQTKNYIPINVDYVL